MLYKLCDGRYHILVNSWMINWRYKMFFPYKPAGLKECLG